MSLTVDFLRKSNLRANLEPLPLDTRVGGGQIAELGQGLQSFVVAAFASQPARREGQEHNTGGQNEARNHLDEEGKAPRPLASHVAGAVGYPEGDYNAEDDTKLLQNEEGAADLGRCDLGDVEWCNASQTACCQCCSQEEQSKD